MKYSPLNFEVKLPDQPILFEADSLYARLQELVDQRKCRGRLYQLAPILWIALLAKLMGHNQWPRVVHPLRVTLSWLAVGTKGTDG